MDWKRFEGSGNKGEGEKGKTLTTKDTTLTVRGQARLAEALRGSECPKIPSKNPTPKIHLKTMGPKKKAQDKQAGGDLMGHRTLMSSIWLTPAQPREAGSARSGWGDDA